MLPKWLEAVVDPCRLYAGKSGGSGDDKSPSGESSREGLQGLSRQKAMTDHEWNVMLTKAFKRAKNRCPLAGTIQGGALILFLVILVLSDTDVTPNNLNYQVCLHTTQ